jgi:hypothetical protein
MCMRPTRTTNPCHTEKQKDLRIGLWGQSPIKIWWELYVPNVLTIKFSAFCTCGFCTILSDNKDYFLNSINHLILVMVKGSVLFEARNKTLNIIQTSFGFKPTQAFLVFLCL